MVERGGAPTVRMQRWLDEATKRLNADIGDLSDLTTRIAAEESVSAELAAELAGLSALVVNLSMQLGFERARNEQLFGKVSDLENLSVA